MFTITHHNETLYNLHAECWHSWHGLTEGQSYANLDRISATEDNKRIFMYIISEQKQISIRCFGDYVTKNF
jgi:hypothetical protein